MNTRNKSIFAARIAAALFLIWGLLHLVGGIALLDAAAAGADEYLAMLTGVPQVSAIHNPAAMGVFAFHAFNFVWIGALTIWIAVRFNWQNRLEGMWLNLFVVAMADLGLWLFMVHGGVMPLSDAWPGPLLLILALVALGVSRLRREPLGS